MLQASWLYATARAVYGDERATTTSRNAEAACYDVNYRYALTY
jgi:hypothetical protein